MSSLDRGGTGPCGGRRCLSLPKGSPQCGQKAALGASRPWQAGQSPGGSSPLGLAPALETEAMRASRSAASRCVAGSGPCSSMIAAPELCAPHSGQTRALPGISTPHCGHVLIVFSSCWPLPVNKIGGRFMALSFRRAGRHAQLLFVPVFVVSALCQPLDFRRSQMQSHAPCRALCQRFPFCRSTFRKGGSTSPRPPRGG